jgi:hypothetical protein
MKSTNPSRKNIKDDKVNNSIFSTSIPSISYMNVPIKNLLIPADLFDDNEQLPVSTPHDFPYPIIVTKDSESDVYHIIDGCKRLKIQRESQPQTCMCGILLGIIEPQRRGFLRILMNKNRLWSLREKIYYFKWLKKNCDGDNFESIAEEFGFNTSVRYELTPLLTCSEDILEAIVSERISLKNVSDLCRLDPIDQKAFLTTFWDFSLSLQTQREFLEWLPEIAYSKATTVAQLLQSGEIQAILKKSSNAPQKIEAIRSVLYAWKYPRFSEALTQWNHLARITSQNVLENEPSSLVAFNPNPAFEKNRLEIKISIAHANAAHEIFNKLSSIPQSTWAKLIYPQQD